MNEEELLEDLADIEHQQWMHWTRYMLWVLKPVLEDMAGLHLPGLPPGDDRMARAKDAYQRWHRQMQTNYSELTEKEKDSDREWAWRVMGVLCEFGFMSSDFLDEEKAKLPPKTLPWKCYEKWDIEEGLRRSSLSAIAKLDITHDSIEGPTWTDDEVKAAAEALRPLMDNPKHVTNDEGDCVSWCPACGPVCEHGDNSLECEECKKKPQKEE